MFGFEDNLKKLRQNRNLSQEALGEKLELEAPQSGINQLERRDSNPTLKTLKKLCDALNCEAKDLIGF